MLNSYTAKLLSLLFYVFWLSACTTQNVPYHSNSLQAETVNEKTRPAGIKNMGDYDLAFVEFSDRGNVFDRKQMDNTLALIKKHADAQGATVITFIHGWKHNSHPDDTNLKDFKRLLASTATKAKTQSLKTPRRLIGVFISWRGLSIKTAGLKNVTYWSRKKVAHDVGRGGITELLLRLERTIYRTDPTSTKNILINVGHSFGGAILLSALNDVLMSRMLDTTTNSQGCVKTRPFGHANVLVNPAVEANEIFQLKELVKQHPCYDENQSKLLHIISSDADRSTKMAFKIGQWLGLSLRRKEADLEREYAISATGETQKFTIRERDLDTVTIANFPTFRTGKSVKRDVNNPQQQCASSDNNRNECYISCKAGNHACVNKTEQAKHIPVVSNEPLSFVYTDKEFMKSHTDIFNPHIAGYIAAITRHAQFKYLSIAKGKTAAKQARFEKECLDTQRNFDFGGCFYYFQKEFGDLNKQEEKQAQS
jgi:hypothetical protein